MKKILEDDSLVKNLDAETQWKQVEAGITAGMPRPRFASRLIIGLLRKIWERVGAPGGVDTSPEVADAIAELQTDVSNLKVRLSELLANPDDASGDNGDAADDAADASGDDGDYSSDVAVDPFSAT